MHTGSLSATSAASRLWRGLTCLLATLGGNTFIIVGSVILGIPATLFGWLPPRGWLVEWLGRSWCRGLLWASGTSLETHYAAPLLPGRGYIFMANHQSLYDVPALVLSLPGRSCFLAKRSLFRIPFFGWSLQAGGYIPVDRGSHQGAHRTFKKALARLEERRSVVLFPEETRSPDGTLGCFKPGGFLIALKTGYPIVPVAIRGSREVQSKTSFRIRPGRLEVLYGKPIETSGRGIRDKGQIMDQLRGAIEELLSSDGRAPAEA